MTFRRDSSKQAASQSLEEAIARGGFYPDLTLHTVREALDGREASHQIVHVDTHFDMEEVQRHITVLALADDVLVVAHLDDHDFEADDAVDTAAGQTVARVSTEVVPISRIRSLILSEVHRSPENFDPQRALAEVTLTLHWTGAARFETTPAQCADPECIADHGDNGTVVPDDIMLRIAATAEGHTAVDEARSFVRALRRAGIRHA